MIQQQIAPNRLASGQKLGLRDESQSSKPLRELTYRERDILTLAARGLSNKRIAFKLGISSRTVRCTLHNACTKLGARSRLEAVYTAVALGQMALDEILSLDELTAIFMSLSSEALRETAKRLKRSQFDELVNLLVTFEPTMLQKVARRLKQSQEQLQLPPIASKRMTDLSHVSHLRLSEKSG
jgi:DNA-binding CsgD family transcriptional regulator